MAVVHIERDHGSLYSYRIVQRIGIAFFKKEVFIMVAESFVEPPRGGEKIEDPVHFGPSGAYFREGIFGQLFNITVEYQVPVVFVIIIFQNPGDDFTVYAKIITSAGSHVQITYYEDLTSPGKIQHGTGVKPGTDNFREKR
jgi:hypothetical protein